MPIAVIPHPFGTRSREEVRKIADGCAADIAHLLCEAAPANPATTAAAAPATPRARLIEAPGELDELNRFFIKRRWGDGLIVAPPTEEAVARMLRHTRRAPDEIVATIAPGMGAATVEYIAIQGVMAGCYPEYLPILIAAAEAVATPQFHLQAIQATTNPSAVWLIVNGPIARWLEVNSGAGCLGQGAWANATLGRALRLILQNIGGALPGEMDKATQGQSAKYTFCCAENEAASPWEPLHVERGFAKDASTVTVVGAECPHNINDHESLSGEGILTTIAGTMATTGSNDIYYAAQPVIVMGPEHAKTVAADGYSKRDAKLFLQQHAQLPLGKFSKENIERRFRVTFKEKYAKAGLDAPVFTVQNADDIIIVVIGGAGKHSAYIPTFGATKAVTRALQRKDGQLAKSVAEFRPG